METLALLFAFHMQDEQDEKEHQRLKQQRAEREVEVLQNQVQIATQRIERLEKEHERFSREAKKKAKNRARQIKRLNAAVARRKNITSPRRWIQIVWRRLTSLVPGLMTALFFLTRMNER